MQTDSETARGKWLVKAAQNRSDAAATRNLMLTALLIEIADTYDHLAELPSAKIDALIKKDIHNLKDLSRRPLQWRVELQGND